MKKEEYLSKHLYPFSIKIMQEASKTLENYHETCTTQNKTSFKIRRKHTLSYPLLLDIYFLVYVLIRMNVKSLNFFLKNFNNLSNNNLILTKNEFLVHLKYWSQAKDHFLITLLIPVPTSSTVLVCMQ